MRFKYNVVLAVSLISMAGVLGFFSSRRVQIVVDVYPSTINLGRLRDDKSPFFPVMVTNHSKRSIEVRRMIYGCSCLSLADNSQKMPLEIQPGETACIMSKVDLDGDIGPQVNDLAVQIGWDDMIMEPYQIKLLHNVETIAAFSPRRLYLHDVLPGDSKEFIVDIVSSAAGDGSLQVKLDKELDENLIVRFLDAPVETRQYHGQLVHVLKRAKVMVLAPETTSTGNERLLQNLNFHFWTADESFVRSMPIEIELKPHAEVIPRTVVFSGEQNEQKAVLRVQLQDLDASEIRLVAGLEGFSVNISATKNSSIISIEVIRSADAPPGLQGELAFAVDNGQKFSVPIRTLPSL